MSVSRRAIRRPRPGCARAWVAATIRATVAPDDRDGPGTDESAVTGAAASARVHTAPTALAAVTRPAFIP